MGKNYTAAKTANKLSFIESITPKTNSYVLTDCGVCRVFRILMFVGPDGKLVFKRVLEMSNGYFMEEDERTEPLFTTRIAQNIVTADDVKNYRFCFIDDVDPEVMADEILGELGEWGIDTVQKEGGSMVSLQDYINETILKK